MEKMGSNREEEEEEKDTETKIFRKKKRKTPSKNERRPWSELPDELLELIKKQLYFADQLNFSAVCKSWNFIERFQPSKQMPWLLVFEETKRNSWGTFKLVDSTSKKTYTVDMKAIKEKTQTIKNFKKMKVLESKYGWLLISSRDIPKKTSLFLYSPFFDENNNFIELPILNWRRSTLSFATFTSNPSEKNCSIITINNTLDEQVILVSIYGHGGGKSSWSSRYYWCGFSCYKIECWKYSKGIFYYATRDNKFGSLDLAQDKWRVITPPPMTWNDGLTLYIVKSDEEKELFLIYSSMEKNKNEWHYFVEDIYRLDLSLMVWKRSSNLGDKVLFIGNGYNRVLKFSEEEIERAGISNRIYNCLGLEFKFCTVHDWNADNNGGPNRSHPCTRHYGSIATKERCRKFLIDPPHGLTHSLNF